MHPCFSLEHGRAGNARPLTQTRARFPRPCSGRRPAHGRACTRAGGSLPRRACTSTPCPLPSASMVARLRVDSVHHRPGADAHAHAHAGGGALARASAPMASSAVGGLINGGLLPLLLPSPSPPVMGQPHHLLPRLAVLSWFSSHFFSHFFTLPEKTPRLAVNASMHTRGCFRGYRRCCASERVISQEAVSPHSAEAISTVKLPRRESEMLNSRRESFIASRTVRQRRQACPP